MYAIRSYYVTLFGAIGSLFKGIWHAIDGFRKVLHLILLLVIFGILFAATRSSLPFVSGDAAKRRPRLVVRPRTGCPDDA